MSIQLVVFDAYGTLFDVDAAARDMSATEPRLADLWPRLAADWRRKQLEYSWLREVMGDYVDFWQLTRDGLDWAMAAQGLDDPALAEKLMGLYRELPAFPEVPAMLDALHHRGVGRAILTNGSPDMVGAAVHAAGIGHLLDDVLSVDSVKRFKPAADVYALVEARMGVPPDQVLFVSSNGWDAAGAARFGFRVAWVNRAGLPVDHLPARPTHQLSDLAGIPELI
ncbi:haloacid dehalogenase type II [Pseudothioclava nitratireducens]|uniref:haloacid dehalogenase type II n=1 Tax=Pseudothioclava nitratireducens TaxID=1928646 RepID=UPI0023DB91E0|nr:haloacid dehalogenase type II [Defluviimonas nitratireducens]MDF1620971.1 haloacid dehalogenase type II [Defluviimonas nitratireducens]